MPILVGGTGEKRTLRTLAKYGDILNYDGWAGRGMSVEVFRHKVSVLERHCEAVGRDRAEIKRSLLMPLVITDDPAAIERSRQFFGRRANTRYGNYAGRLMKAQEVEAAVGSLNEVIDLIVRFAEEGVDEIMFGAIPYRRRGGTAAGRAGRRRDILALGLPQDGCDSGLPVAAPEAGSSRSRRASPMY